MTPPVGTAIDKVAVPLFSPLILRGLEFHNRIWVSPMCQYSATTDGQMTEYHLVHYGAFSLRGPSLTIIEATAVTREGRITPYDCGLWDDDQIAPLKRVVDFAHEQRQKVGIQLAHAGRKASTVAPWQIPKGSRSSVAQKENGGWPDCVIGPSDLQWGPGAPLPVAISKIQIAETILSFARAARRAVLAGIDVIEIHAAHGYLLSSFLSPISNMRNDEYGGTLENRVRFACQVVDAVRDEIPASMPLTFRVSATEWLDNDQQWGIDDTVQLAAKLEGKVDLLCISSGGNDFNQKIPASPTYQTDLAWKVRKALHDRNVTMKIGAVGRVSDSSRANALVDDGEPALVRGRCAVADVVLIGRQFLKEPGWVLRAAHELSTKVQWPDQFKLARYTLETKL